MVLDGLAANFVSIKVLGELVDADRCGRRDLGEVTKRDKDAEGS
jgi:hypothetical protein